MSYMLYPARKRKRIAARTALGYATADSIRKSVSKLEDLSDVLISIIQYEDVWLRTHHRSTVKYTSPVAYYHGKFRYVTQAAKRLPPGLVRDLLTLGFIVHMMYRAHVSGKRAASNVAQTYLGIRYKGDPSMMHSDDNALKEVIKLRAIAHLAAAYFWLIIGDSRNTVGTEVRSATLSDWKKKMPDFLYVAKFFQDFLCDPEKQLWNPILFKLPEHVLRSDGPVIDLPVFDDEEAADWVRAYPRA